MNLSTVRLILKKAKDLQNSVKKSIRLWCPKNMKN